MQNETIMTKYEFTRCCSVRLTGIYKLTAQLAIDSKNNELTTDLFVRELLEQDSDKGSRSGTRYILGEELYEALQKFK